ncbi:MAG: uL15m family ribosomal protein [Candidatus Nanoarchaeia archaeon]
MVVKTHKKRKSKGQRGWTTHGHGARKKWQSSGHKGGKGMSGTGKRADHKKSLVIKLYGNKYFGKQGITSKSTEKDRSKVMNLRDIQDNFESLMKKYGKDKELCLSEYKILGEGEIKEKAVIRAKAFSESAKQKIEAAGGKAIEENKKQDSENKEEKKAVKKDTEKKETKTKKSEKKLDK